MAERQDFLCAVCGSEPPPRLRQQKQMIDNFVIDHSHATGKVRGLVCNTCNVALGMLHDDAQKARNVAVYLEKHNPQPSAAEIG